MKRMLFFLLILCLCVWGCGDEVLAPQVLEIVSPAESGVSAPPESVWDGIRLDPRYFRGGAELEASQRAFYTKYVDADGIAILSHASIEDVHLLEARNVVIAMTLRYPELREQLRVQHGFYMILFKHATGYGDITYLPEMTFSDDKCVWGHPDANIYRFCSASITQEHLGHMDTFTHEFAHALHLEIERVSPGFSDRLAQAYQQAKASGAYRNLWDPYIISNVREYWAEGVTIWYYGIGADREFKTHEAFAAVDPLLYELLSESFYRGTFPRTPIPGIPQYDILWERVSSEHH